MRTPTAHLDPAVRKARAAELNRRRIEARRRALKVFAKRYPEEFQRILSEQMTEVHQEKGPLPGDGGTR